jgi:hypothetical protein
MQTQIFRKVFLGLMALGLTLSMFAILSCSSGDDDNTANETRLQANLLAINEVPPAPQPNPGGSGTSVLIISEDEQSLNYTLTYAGVNNVTQAQYPCG